jgi:hypothetical protein
MNDSLAQRDEVITILQKNSDSFFAENIKFLELINQTDSRIMSDCTQLNTLALEKFQDMLT